MLGYTTKLHGGNYQSISEVVQSFNPKNVHQYQNRAPHVDWFVQMVLDSLQRSDLNYEDIDTNYDKDNPLATVAKYLEICWAKKKLTLQESEAPSSSDNPRETPSSHSNPTKITPNQIAKEARLATGDPRTKRGMKNTEARKQRKEEEREKKKCG